VRTLQLFGLTLELGVRLQTPSSPYDSVRGFSRIRAEDLRRRNSLNSMNLRTELIFRNCILISEGLPGLATGTVK
jgi:hypothetical protein